MTDNDTMPSSEAETSPEPESAQGGEPREAAETAPASLEARLAQAERERDDNRERMLRIAAEFENWKRRARRDQDDAQFKAKEQVLKDILEVADNLERALSSMGESTDAKAVRDGVSLVLRLFQQKLERHEVRPIEAKGKPFDPRVHEAVASVPSADVPVGAVLEELVKGYNLGERLLRPASVVVALAPPAATPASGSQGDA
ncbi:MAG: nucleotide exchange factor GrpE [Myxococcales bacterium]|nr:nucleotide exchange factor GrpE [Myxococcales bacterium]